MIKKMIDVSGSVKNYQAYTVDLISLLYLKHHNLY